MSRPGAGRATGRTRRGKALDGLEDWLAERFRPREHPARRLRGGGPCRDGRPASAGDRAFALRRRRRRAAAGLPADPRRRPDRLAPAIVRIRAADRRRLLMPIDHETLLSMLTRLKLTAIRDQLDTLLDEAAGHELSLREALGFLCQREVARKDERRIEMATNCSLSDGARSRRLRLRCPA